MPRASVFDDRRPEAEKAKDDVRDSFYRAMLRNTVLGLPKMAEELLGLGKYTELGTGKPRRLSDDIETAVMGREDLTGVPEENSAFGAALGDVASLIPLRGLFGKAPGRSQLNMWIGPSSPAYDVKAAQAVKDALAKANPQTTLALDKFNAQVLRDKGGWYEPASGQVVQFRRDVTPDAVIERELFNLGPPGNTAKVKDLLRREDLQAYPGMSELEVSLNPQLKSTGAAFPAKDGQPPYIQFNPGKVTDSAKFPGYLRHELSHLIENREGLPVGGNQRMTEAYQRWLEGNAVNTGFTRLSPRLQAQYRAISGKDPFDLYESLMGERMANRAMYHGPEFRAVPPTAPPTKGSLVVGADGANAWDMDPYSSFISGMVRGYKPMRAPWLPLTQP